MDYSLTFARHFARLLWLLRNEDQAFDTQIAALQAVVSASGGGPVTLVTRGRELLANDGVIPDRFTGVDELTARLLEHSVATLVVERNSPPADLLLLARLLAGPPGDPADRSGLADGLATVGARSIHVTIASAPPARESARDGAPPLAGMISDTSLFVPAPAAPAHRVPEAAAPPKAIETDRGTEAMFQPLPPTGSPKDAMITLFERLDAASDVTAATRQLDALLMLATESASRERFDLVADIFHGIVTREGAVEDREIQRQLGVYGRRLTTPGILRCVAELLPRRRECYEQYMTIFARAEETGAEALVDALISAPSLTDRRVYYDALLRVRAGVRTLIHLLGDPRWFVVRNAAELLGEMGVTEAVVELTALLDHRDDRVRLAAANAVARLGAAPAGATPGAVAAVRERTAGAFARGTDGRTSVESLGRAFEKEEDDRVRMAILAALGQIGTAPAIEKLASIARTDKGLLARNHPTPLRVAAVHALGQVKAAGAIAALQSLLRDRERAVRGAASWVLMGRKRQPLSAP